MHEHSIVRTNCPWVSEDGKIVNLFQTLYNFSPTINAALQPPPALNNDACTSNMCSPHNKRYLAECSLRKYPFLLALRREEKRMFSQARPNEKERANERAVRNTREVRKTPFALHARLCRRLLNRLNL